MGKSGPNSCRNFHLNLEHVLRIIVLALLSLRCQVCRNKWVYFLPWRRQAGQQIIRTQCGCCLVQERRWEVNLHSTSRSGEEKDVRERSTEGMVLAKDSAFQRGFPGGSGCKEFACNAGDLGSIPGLRRSPGGGPDNPLQYSCLENPMDRGAWRATVHGVTKSWT